VLIRSDNDMFPRSSYVEPTPRATTPLLGIVARLAPSRSVNLSYRRTLHAFAAALAGEGATSVLVIGAGSQKSWLDKFFSGYPGIRIAYSDIDTNATVDLFCDAHELPFHDETFGGVVASAVLEHVARPERVAAEMHRVLVSGGLLYTEIPFLQQVHEGAYDFTRYTLSGHRRLLNHFEEVASGVVAGPATTLAWALEHFALCFTPRVLMNGVRLAVRTAFFWLKYFDHLFGQSAAAADGASCTFFLGRKSASTKPDSEIVARYVVGVKTVRHV
jgi:SAM-dependent methyltransferase